MFNSVCTTLREAGVLRLVLFAFTVFLILAAPFAFAEESRSGWRLFTTTVVPALIPPMFFIYPLDMTMCRVRMDGAPDDTRARMKRMIWLNVWSMVALLLAWLPFFLRLLN